MADKLKPCPFCGRNKLTVSRYFGLNCYTVRCINEDCGMKIVTDFAKTKKEAIELWNTRPNPWHTGTPTEIKGWFLFKYRAYGKFVYRTLENPVIDIFADSELEWHKIEETD